MFHLKIHDSGGKTVCAACDSEILGKVLEENGRVLDIDAEFFGGRKVPLKKIGEIADSIKLLHTSNIVGSRIVFELVKIGALKACSVKEICGVKYAMVFKINKS